MSIKDKFKQASSKVDAYKSTINTAVNEEKLQKLSDGLDSNFQKAKEAIDLLDSNFINQINNDKTKMLNAFDKLQAIVVNMKTDMLSLLSIQVDYIDADGD